MYPKYRIFKLLLYNVYISMRLIFSLSLCCLVLSFFFREWLDLWLFCKAQPHRASLSYPFRNTAAHTEATPTREGI